MADTGATVTMAIVIPCYNEAHRLRDEAIADLLQLTPAHLVMVDDGSHDHTLERLTALAAAHDPRITVLPLTDNGGKADAVRRGMHAALDLEPDVVAYCDADFAAPPSEIARLVATLVGSDDVDVVLGSRIAMLGTAIERSPLRHYLGRMFATAASLSIGMTVYDTQCGAKAFRVTPALRDAVARPFRSRWAFDVEFLSRLRLPSKDVPGVDLERFLEVPLAEWRDVNDSKLTLLAALRSGVDLACIALRQRCTRGR